jgi:hypothetical protein
VLLVILLLCGYATSSMSYFERGADVVGDPDADRPNGSAVLIGRRT